MNKKTLGLLVAMVLVAPSVASASTNAYNPISGSCRGEDVAVVEYDGSRYTPVSCLPAEDFARATMPVAPADLVSVAPGAWVGLIDGTRDVCPLWFGVGCVVERAIFAFLL